MLFAPPLHQSRALTNLLRDRTKRPLRAQAQINRQGGKRLRRFRLQLPKRLLHHFISVSAGSIAPKESPPKRLSPLLRTAKDWGGTCSAFGETGKSSPASTRR